MDRRTFIKGTAAVAATAVLPIPAAVAEPELSGVAIAQAWLASLPSGEAPYPWAKVWFDAEQCRLQIEEITGIDLFYSGEQWTEEECERMRRGRA